VNVASQCGFTSQNAGLQKLQDTFGGKGFTVLAFPSNEFGGQEPGNDEQIEQFVCTKFNGTYPLTKKCCVNGDSAEPVWAYMKHAKPGLLGFEAVKWNYTKMLVDREGKVIERYAPTTTPETIAKDIEKLLK
jgi:glutathione peroxidase